MAFEKGKKKTGGREKGTPNKLDAEARQLFKETLEGEVPNIQSAFEAVYKKDPARYLDLFAKYAKYFMPEKLELSQDQDSPILPVMNITFRREGEEETNE